MDSIIICGKQSVPLLVEALSDSNHVKAGDAAYCLEKIGAVDGRDAAKAALDRIRQQPKFTTTDDYAVPLLENYLRSIGAGK